MQIQGTKKQRTTQRIKDSLLGLVESARSIDEVTVTDICKTAGINRATFYYHYDSVHAVLKDVSESAEREFSHFLEQSTIKPDGTPEKSFYVTFFEFVKRNYRLCKIILKSSPSIESSFLKNALDSGRNKVVNEISGMYPGISTEKIDYYYIFASHGFLGLLNYWLDNGMKESVTAIAEIGEKISTFGLGYMAPLP